VSDTREAAGVLGGLPGMAVKKKPHISVTQVDMLAKCGEQYFRRYVMGEKTPPGIALIAGRGLHGSSERQLKHKVETGGQLPTVEAAQDWAADAFHASLGEQGIVLDEEQEKLGVEKVTGMALDATVTMARGYLEAYTPTLNPVPGKVEWSWRLETDWTHDVEGVVDVVHMPRPDVIAISDTKSKIAKAPNKTEADESFQLSMYALAHKAHGGILPLAVSLDFVIARQQKAGGYKPDPLRLVSLRTAEDMEPTVARLKRAVDVINAGAFVPAKPTDWACSAKWCGYFSTCKFAQGFKHFGASPETARAAREASARKLMGLAEPAAE